jgi:hypothetical protein
VKMHWSERCIPEPNSGCWLWLGSTDKLGYGKVNVGGHYLAHRLAYADTVGPIPDGMLVLHRCDMPSCVNPEHLYVGDDQDNMDDMVERGRGNSGWRGMTHCVNGHEWNEENTYWRGKWRNCRVCGREGAARRKAERV